MAMTGNTKGMMFTLVVLVLFILMLAQLLTFVLLSISNDSLSATAAQAFAGASVSSSVTSAVPTFLHQSLYRAVNTLSLYASKPATRQSRFINNSALAIKSLMMNGTIYGTDMSAQMGNAIMNKVVAQALEGTNITISNVTITVFQAGPSNISATYTALAAIGASQGSLTSQIAATATVQLNGTADPFLAEVGAPAAISLKSALPTGVVVGNDFAIAGGPNTGNFIYGPVIKVGLVTSGCGGIPSAFQNPFYILMTVNAANIVNTTVCSMGGLVANVFNVLDAGNKVAVPFLRYKSPSNTFNAMQNGTSALLSVRGSELLNISAVQAAAMSGSYYQSQYMPAYLDWAQGGQGNRSINGMFSFSFMSRKAATFNAFSNIVITNSIQLNPPNNMSVFAWIKPSVASSNAILHKGTEYGMQILGGKFQGFVNTNTFKATNIINQFTLNNNIWYFVGFTYNNSGGFISSTNAVIFNYVNGRLYSGGDYGGTNALAVLSNALTIGGAAPLDVFGNFIGNITDVQIYNASLTQEQVMQLYREGLAGVPISTWQIRSSGRGGGPIVSNQVLGGWWPLNGNATEISGANALGGNNGVSNLMSWHQLPDFQGDYLRYGYLYYNTTFNSVSGIGNCGNVLACNTNAVQHFYISNSALTGTSNSVLNTSASMGIANALFP